jgi:hypothetical protein
MVGVDAVLQGVAMRQELAVAWAEVAEKGAQSRPERVGGQARAGQGFRLDEAVQHARHPQTRDLDAIHERLLLSPRSAGGGLRGVLSRKAPTAKRSSALRAPAEDDGASGARSVRE